MRLALCQINPTVGDIDGNLALIGDRLRCAGSAGAQLVLFPELALTGYPPEDLLLREHFLADAQAALEELARRLAGTSTTVVVGYPERDGGQVYNSAAALSDGAVRLVYRKLHLPNYGVFDERRYFAAGAAGATLDLAGRRVGLTVCEDLWQPGPPATEEAAAGASLLVNISASPYHAGKGAERERLFAARAVESGAHVAFCALVGGQDELVFDGHSFVLDPSGATIARGTQFTEDMLICELEPGADNRVQPTLEPVEAEVYAALLLGLRDYVDKNGFAGVVLGLSGGIDSALVACLAVDALGPERVNVVIMPSPYSSSETQADARALAATLGVRVHELAIEPAMSAYAEILREDFAGLPTDLTEENLQARIRGNLLMALSNKLGWLVLTTGNKSEMSVGYTTLYGDLAGGFAVIKDVPKTLVYRLCEWRNSPAGAPAPAHADSSSITSSHAASSSSSSLITTSSTTTTPLTVAGVPSSPPTMTEARARAPIPPSILARAPSAELRHEQRDADSLPPYELLDRILHGYIELDHSRERLIADGLPAAEVDRTIRLVDLAEYKRRQAPPGIKVTTRAFGRDRRMPITNGYRG